MMGTEDRIEWIGPGISTVAALAIMSAIWGALNGGVFVTGACNQPKALPYLRSIASEPERWSATSFYLALDGAEIIWIANSAYGLEIWTEHLRLTSNCKAALWRASKPFIRTRDFGYAHNAHPEGTLSEPVTTDGAEGPANAPK